MENIFEVESTKGTKNILVDSGNVSGIYKNVAKEFGVPVDSFAVFYGGVRLIPHQILSLEELDHIRRNGRLRMVVVSRQQPGIPSRASRSFQITFRTVSSVPREFELKIASAETNEELYEKVAEHMHFPVEEIALMLAGQKIPRDGNSVPLKVGDWLVRVVRVQKQATASLSLGGSRTKPVRPASR